MDYLESQKLKFEEFNNSKKNNRRLKKNPEYFSWLFENIIYGINSTLGIYLILSSIFSSFYFIFNSEFNANWTELNFFNLNNFLSNIIILFFIITGYVTTHKKSFTFLCLYISILILINFNFLLRKNTPTNDQLNSLKSNTINNIFDFIFCIIIISTNLSIAIYSVYYCCFSQGIINFNLYDTPVIKIIHEIKLQSDLIKMNFNCFIIGTGFNKYIPWILFRQSGYHFFNCTCEFNEKENFYRGDDRGVCITNIRNTDNIENIEINENERIILNKEKLNFSKDSQNLNSKSTIDCDYE